MSAYEHVVSALEAAGCRKGQGNDYQCPTHDDRKPSLGVTKADDRVLVHCSAGCRTEDVLAALGLGMTDLFDSKKESQPPTIEETYDYVDELGTVLFQVVRKSDKQFLQRRPNGEGGWIWGVKGVRRVPYRLPDVIEALGRGSPVYIVEGEKDVHALEAAGYCATCNPMGAGAWRPGYSEAFRNTESGITIIADRDDAGIKHARDVAESLRAVGTSAPIVQTPLDHKGADAADHFAAGLEIDDLVLLDDPDDDSHGELDRIGYIGCRYDELDAAPPPAVLRNLLSNEPHLGTLVAAQNTGKSRIAAITCLHWGTETPLFSSGFGDGSRALYISAEQTSREIYQMMQRAERYTDHEGETTYGFGGWRDRVMVVGRELVHDIGIAPLTLDGTARLRDLLDVQDGFGLVVLDSGRRLLPAKFKDSDEVSPLLDAIDGLAIETGAYMWMLLHCPHEARADPREAAEGAQAFGQVPRFYWFMRRHSRYPNLRRLRFDGNDFLGDPTRDCRLGVADGDNLHEPSNGIYQLRLLDDPADLSEFGADMEPDEGPEEPLPTLSELQCTRRDSVERVARTLHAYLRPDEDWSDKDRMPRNWRKKAERVLRAADT